jgi:DNA-binding MarR family transcriptional regulator
VAGVKKQIPLSALLSQIWVAFTIESDNEVERQVAHRTTHFGSTPGTGKRVWLASMAMWWHFLQFVRDEGTRAGELKRLTGRDAATLRRWLTRLSKWWGYLKIEYPPGGDGKTSKADLLVKPTQSGLKAIRAWRSVSGEIERRWRERFGGEAIDALRDTLVAILQKADEALPDCLPIVGYAMTRSDQRFKFELRDAAEGLAERPLPVLLAKVLLLFAREFEGESKMSLAICANVLRPVEADGTPVRELPRLAGVSKQSIAVAVNFLTSKGLAVEMKPPAGGAKLLVLKPKGEVVRARYFKFTREIEARWKERFGAEVVEALRASLERMAGGSRGKSRLLECVKPYPEGWRAQVPEIAVLPHFPLVTHRGGYPDGS